MKWIKKILKFAGWSLLCIVLVYIVFLRSFFMHWGSTRMERDRYYTGDSIVTDPDYINTLAVAVEKPPSAIWPWIAQMGLNRGGFYSYTGIENIFGCKLHNADRIHPEWQNPKEGDYEPVCNSAAESAMPGWTILKVIPGKALVYKSSLDSTWTMGFYIDSINNNSSRLITRMRYMTPRTFWLYLADKAWMEWAHCIMQKGAINGIKKRVERKL